MKTIIHQLGGYKTHGLITHKTRGLGRILMIEVSRTGKTASVRILTEMFDRPMFPSLAEWFDWSILTPTKREHTNLPPIKA